MGEKIFKFNPLRIPHLRGVSPIVLGIGGRAVRHWLATWASRRKREREKERGSVCKIDREGVDVRETRSGSGGKRERNRHTQTHKSDTLNSLACHLGQSKERWSRPGDIVIVR
jgi:hypothetical protein